MRSLNFSSGKDFCLFACQLETSARSYYGRNYVLKSQKLNHYTNRLLKRSACLEQTELERSKRSDSNPLSLCLKKLEAFYTARKYRLLDTDLTTTQQMQGLLKKSKSRTTALPHTKTRVHMYAEVLSRVRGRELKGEVEFQASISVHQGPYELARLFGYSMPFSRH